MKILTALIVLGFMLSVCEVCNVGDKKNGNSNSNSSSANSSDTGSSDGGDFADDSMGDCNSDNEEDDAWCKRLKIARMKSQPPHVSVGEIPDDPNVSSVYDAPVVFVKTQLYIYMSSQTYKLEGYGDNYRDTQKYYFFATGRFYYRNQTYAGQTTPAGNVAEIWGRYHFTKPDEMEVETDKGEKQTFPVTHGRRNLVFGETTYGQVDWENEALQKQLNQ